MSPSSEILTYKYEDVTYLVQPLHLTVSHLKIVLSTQIDDEKYTDRIDLYLASSRRAFSKACSEKFMEDMSVFEADLHKIITELESLRDSKATDITIKELTKDDEKEARKTLKNENILDEWLSDCRGLGYVGEDNNLKIGLLAVVSRLLDNPLSVIFKSSPASGKSHLLNLFCSICPPEKLLYSSKLTSASLYYSNDLKHKLVAVDEAHGSSDVLYPLRSLISSKKLILSAPLKEPGTGQTLTKQTIVHGPIAYMESTTGDIHPENLSRAILLNLDESKEQSLRILESQRQKVARDYSDNSEKIFNKWRNIGRLLAKNSKSVVIPFVDKLRFPTGPNSRRDFQKFLSLIQSVALLKVLQNQHRKIPEESTSQPQWMITKQPMSYISLL